MATQKEILALMEGDEFHGLVELLHLAEQAVPHLVEFSQNKKLPFFVRQRALVALGEIGLPQGDAAIVENLKDENPVQRLTAVRALAQIRGVTANVELKGMLDDEDVSVRKVALQCIANFGDTSVLPALGKMAETDGEDFLKKEAKRAMSEIHHRQGKE